MSYSSQSKYRSKRSEAQQSEIERVHRDAQEVLTHKTERILQISQDTEEAEKELSRLRAELEGKIRMFSANENVAILKNIDENDYVLDDSDSYSQEDEIEELKNEHAEEISKLKAKQEDEIHNYRINFTKALKEAERWAEQHADTVYIGKKAEYVNLTREYEEMKARINEDSFNSTQSRTKLHQLSKSQSLQNTRRIQQLDDELTELSSVTREELRDVRTKIDECFVAVEIREREHNSEIEKYELEIKRREEKYNAHIQTLNEQFNNERQKLEKQLQMSTTQRQNLDRILKSLGKHYEMQLQTTTKDIERMRTTINKAQSRDEQMLSETKTNVTAIQSVQRESKQTEKEIMLVNQEIIEIQNENRELQMEIKRVKNNVRERMMKLKR